MPQVQVTANNVVYVIVPSTDPPPAGRLRVPDEQLMFLAQQIAAAAANNQSAVAQIGECGVEVVGNPADVAASIKQAIHEGTLVVY